VEYADVFGIPFDFTAKPVIAPPQPPRETVQVKAMRPERDTLEIRFPRVEGYRVELPEERLTADFNDDSILVLSPDLVGPSITRNSGIIGEGVDLSLEHLGDMRPSTLVFQVTQRLLYTKWRDPGEEPKLHLFGQLKRITKQWLDTCLVCKGGTYPALLMYQELADMACNRITAAITRQFLGERPMKALLDPYNSTGSTSHVRFNTSRADRWDTSGRPLKNHVNWVVLDVTGKPNFAASPNRIPRWSRTPRTTTSASKCRIATAPRRGNIYPTSSCWWMTGTAPMTRCISWSRSRAIAARTPRRRRPQWTPTGCPA
jgi:type III restriction enzyme